MEERGPEVKKEWECKPGAILTASKGAAWSCGLSALMCLVHTSKRGFKNRTLLSQSLF